MFVDLEGLFSGSVESVEIDYSFPLSDARKSGENPFSSPVKVEGEIFNHAGLVELDADACFSYTAMCDRCCELSTVEYVVPVIHSIVSHLENEEDDDEYIVVPDKKLDLDALVAEDIFLDLPPVHLCKDDCKGICPVCGVNLNEASCDCKKPIDPRLEDLLSLMD